MTETKKLTLLPLRDTRDERIGRNLLKGPCYICGQQVEGFHEAPGCQLIYYLCPKCNHEYWNVKLAIDGRYGFVYTHSWHGLSVQIERSSGATQAATVSNLQMHDSKVYVVCTWFEAHRPMQRPVTYADLMALNSNLPELHSVNVFHGIPIDISYQEQANKWITAMKSG